MVFRRSALVAAGILAEGHVSGGVVVVSGHVGPAEFHRLDAILKCLIYVENAAAFGSQQPLVSVGRQSVDMAGSHIERKCAKSLNGIYQKNAAGYAWQISPIA